MRKLAVFGGMAAMLTALVVYFPLAWVGGRALPEDVQPRPVFSGTIWNGTVSGIPQVGPVTLKTSFAELLKGGRGVSFKSEAPYLNFEGTAGLRGRASVNVDGNIRGMASMDRRFAGLEGVYKLAVPEITLGEKCQSAAGTFSTDILQRNQRVWEWQGPALSGPVTCENGDVVLTVSGKDPIQDIRAVIRIDPLGAYKIEVDVTTGDTRADLVLPLFGFQKSGRDYRLLEAGRWQ